MEILTLEVSDFSTIHKKNIIGNFDENEVYQKRLLLLLPHPQHLAHTPISDVIHDYKLNITPPSLPPMPKHIIPMPSNRGHHT